jgi:alanyl-tRNA synthetase
MKSSEIRRLFLETFERHGHQRVRSSPLIPPNDPTLFFVNAGMVPFKDLFTGAETRSYNRATSVQKCLRVSGKHNDLENVGRTARHHTFFEMLGNFSFGDYFKVEAIEFAWELLTEVLKLDKDKLWITVFEEDDEAFDLWVNHVGVPERRVQRMGAKDNFWSMGPTGPCGPCTEIHWDHGPEISDNEGGPATEDPRYVEIWNLVFMQYEQLENGDRINLPSPSVDTGAGLERIAAIMQGVYSNYDSDCFTPIIACAADLAGKVYGEDEDVDVALRVIADHARATAFLIADGITPSNEERGYVLRRIMRRAIRFGVKIGLSGDFLWKATDTVVEQMGGVFTELSDRRSFITEIVKAEESRFSNTLERGLALLDQAISKSEGKELAGDVVFKLYDTFGFPLDLTTQIAEERGFTIDLDGYESAMEAQRSAGRAAWKGSGAEALTNLGTGELTETQFCGYTEDSFESTVVAVFSGGTKIESLQQGQDGVLICDVTPFYAESGGQVGDKGTISTSTGEFEVNDVQKGKGGLFLHHGKVSSGSITALSTATLTIDADARNRTKANHSATHLLHAALQTVVGDHVAQKGSLVGPNRLRFDFSHHKPVSQSQVQQIETIVYSAVLDNHNVSTELMGLDDAKASGAAALFGEKYGDEVRVVSMGDASVELCGGTHVNSTGEIGMFKIISESGIAAGVRRIEGVTGFGAMDWVRNQSAIATKGASLLKSNVDQLPSAVERIIAEKRALEKQLEKLNREVAKNASGELATAARDINGVMVISAELSGDASTLREQADRLRDKLGSAVVVLGARGDGSVILVATVSKDLIGKGIHAGKIIKSVAQQVGGGGGGRPDMAQAGGKNPSALPQALDSVYETIASL